MSIIISETRNGSASAYSAYPCSDLTDFIGRIQEVCDRAGMGEEITTSEEACAYLDERHAQRTEVITEEEFRNTEGWDSAVMKCADRLGWIESSDE